ncbi:MAG: TrkH family potassium uptake protein, partial [Oscillospiraceae bacterium]|nr:TrkH family potassium uptake protein [Oscillospiraceae bacterium]
MNSRIVAKNVGRVIFVEALLMVIPLLSCFYYSEPVLPFLIPIILCALIGGALMRVSADADNMFEREGFVTVTLSWVCVSVLGCIPFVINGEIPNAVDALFETVSGFTTTGASILTDIEAMSRSCMFWRMFTHWIGGMGVLVFMMAILPMSGERSMHIMRAELTGPSVDKLVPRVRKTARLLYVIYIGMTLVETLLLLLGGMGIYESLLHSFATAGTGGFSTRALSIASFNSAYIDIVISLFMILFGINFNLYFLILVGKTKSAFKNEELWCYLGIIALSTICVALNIQSKMSGTGEAFRYAFFQVSSIITTTGFATADFNLWPAFSCWILVMLMFIGGCAGSTGGGIIVSRIIILAK